MSKMIDADFKHISNNYEYFHLRKVDIMNISMSGSHRMVRALLE